MSNDAYDAGATIVDPSKVDLRLPQTPQPTYYSGDNVEVIDAIHKLIGEGEIAVGAAALVPKYCVFVIRDNGRVSLYDWSHINRCFAQNGSEACVFQYCLIEHRFIGRARDWFVDERIEKI